MRFPEVEKLSKSSRIESLKNKMLAEKRYLSVEQAEIITESYRKSEGQPKIIKRAMSFALACEKIAIKIDPEELIVGNRTSGVRGGVVFPESGTSWIAEEINDIPTRPQDKFNVREEDKETFFNVILPYWQDKSLEDNVKSGEHGRLIDEIKTVVKVNQKDHAQGHIIPHTEKWLKKGISGIIADAEKKLSQESLNDKQIFYKSVILTLKGAQTFIRRYADLAQKMATASENQEETERLLKIVNNCNKIADSVPETFHEAIQSVWFLFTLLHLESNASSFSPGRLDQILYPFFENDIKTERLYLQEALEILEALYLKFNQIVYLRNKHSASFFAGFPIGFNISLGGKTIDGKDASNILSFLFLKAQEHIGLPQPNLSARIYNDSPNDFMLACTQVISKGSGMPQVVNDDSIVPALIRQGISKEDAINYGVVGCVELSTHGNNLGWSDAAMFNLVKVLELTLNNGVCLQTGKQLGLRTGYIYDYAAYEDLEIAYESQINYFIERMMEACAVVDKLHAEILPSPFLSSVIDDCIEKGVDVTAGGAHYNLSGIQVIQIANVADSFAVIKKCLFEDKKVTAKKLLEALQDNYKNHESLRQYFINKVPKYGNDVDWVDNIGQKWAKKFAQKIERYTNVRGGRCHTGYYTVSAHIPMGKNIGATPDGRVSEEPLADGGMSAMYGRDRKGPSSLLKSVSKIESKYGSNGTLLNMKFLPAFFKTVSDREKFAAMLRAIAKLKINHAQFNVVNKEDLIKAQKDPEKYSNLTIRVAGYTAYFTELAEDLQNEIISRTSFG